jgi:hypothetical protein
MPQLDTAIRLATIFGRSVETLFPNLVTQIQLETAAQFTLRRDLYSPHPADIKIVAIYPSTYRVGIAVFSSLQLEDHGVHKLGAARVPLPFFKRWGTLLGQLITAHRPEIVVVEKLPDSGAKNNPLLPALIRVLKKYARHKGIAVVEYSMTTVRETLLPRGARTSNDMLFRLVASQLPELRAYLPRLERSTGDGVRHFSATFMAAALGLTWIRKHHTPYGHASLVL